MCSGDGGPSMGYPHGAALWHYAGWRDEEAWCPSSSGWWIHIPLGYRKVGLHVMIIRYSDINRDGFSFWELSCFSPKEFVFLDNVVMYIKNLGMSTSSGTEC